MRKKINIFKYGVIFYIITSQCHSVDSNKSLLQEDGQYLKPYFSDVSLSKNGEGIGDDEVLRLLNDSTITKNLQNLDLSNNQIGDIGVQALASANLDPHLLDLSNNQIGDIGVQALASANFPNLQNLDLSYNLITDVGAQKIAHAIESYKWKRIQFLYLVENRIVNRGFEELARIYNPHQHLFDLSGNPFDERGREAWLKIVAMYSATNSQISIKSIDISQKSDMNPE